MAPATRPGPGIRTTSSLRPSASVALASVLRDVLEDLDIGIVGAGRRLADDAAGRDEPRHIVDMAVGVIMGEALVEPDDLARAEGVVQRGLGLALAPAIAVGVEEGLPRGEHRAVAVMVDGAAFEHEVEFPRADARQLGDVVANGRVVGKVELAAPAIGHESQRDGALVASRKDRTGVAQPDVAIARLDELGGGAELGAGRHLGFGPMHQKADAVGRRERAYHGRHIAARRLKVAVPLLGVGGPRRPDRFLRHPLGGNGNRCIGHGISHDCLPIERAQDAQSGISSVRRQPA